MRRPLPPPSTRSRGGFTLVELMVVIFVIAILMAILVPAIMGVMSKAKIGRVRSEITQMETALADLKASPLGVVPPSELILYEDPAGWNTPAGVKSRIKLREMWPDFNFTQQRDLDGDGTAGEADPDGDSIPGIHLNGAECLVFFLGGMRDPSSGAFVGFSKNPRDPFTLTGTNRIGPFTEFAIDRIVDVDNDTNNLTASVGYEYIDSLSGQDAPYLYLNTDDLPTNGRAVSNQLDPFDVFGEGDARNLQQAYYQGTAGAAVWKAKSFQIISPGLDHMYGVGGYYDPDSAEQQLSNVPARVAERDNITNFQDTTLAP